MKSLKQFLKAINQTAAVLQRHPIGAITLSLIALAFILYQVRLMAGA
jgi:hypothetical protein